MDPPTAQSTDSGHHIRPMSRDDLSPDLLSSEVPSRLADHCSSRVLVRKSSVFGERSRAPEVPGLSWPMAATLITGEVAGCGMLALSYAVSLTGPVGAALVLLLGVVAGFCGFCLTHCWIIVEKRHPELASARSRAPYPEIAAQALGTPGVVLVTAALSVCTFGACIVYIIIVADILSDLLVMLPLTYCHWTVVTSILLVPLSWIGTPADLWWVGIVSLATTLITWLLMVIDLVGNFQTLAEAAIFQTPTAMTAFRGLGPILFGYGGAAVFPTIQNDMKDRTQFKRSVACSFVVLISMYTPLAALGYSAMGNNQEPNLISTLHHKIGGPAMLVAKLTFLLHLGMAFFVIINPFFQQMEDLAGIPHRRGITRVLLRTFIMAVQLLLALLIPDFIQIVDVIGSTAIATASFILPPILRMKLLHDRPPADIYPSPREDSDAPPRPPGWDEPPLPLWEKTTIILIPVVGVFVAAISTISSVHSIVTKGLKATSCLIASGNSTLWNL